MLPFYYVLGGKMKNKIIFITIVIITFIVLVLGVYQVYKNKDNIESDSLKFRNEYMELNDRINEKTGLLFKEVTISSNNTIKYINESKTINLLKNGTGIIFFCNALNIDCRISSSIISEIGIDLEETIYYLDSTNITPTFEISNKKLNKVKNGTKNYYKILSYLEKYLNDFYLTDDEGNIYYASEKVLEVPTIIAVSNGDITNLKVISTNSVDGNLTNEELNELNRNITSLIKNNKANNEVCDVNKKC